MSSTFGNILKISLFGESHGKAIGLVIDGLPSGTKIDEDFIYSELDKRKPKGAISTSRNEEDKVVFLSGVMNSVTTGAPLAFYIENNSTRSSDYVKGEMRPGHSDYPAFVKYDGFNDYRGGGQFSGRITASLVVLGAICKSLLAKKNIKIASHIVNIMDVKDAEFDYSSLDKQMDYLNSLYFATLDQEAGKKMEEVITSARSDGDSVGGSLQTVVTGIKAGIGEPYFDSVESRISHLLFSIGGVKGVTFGDGIKFAASYGSQMNDALSYENNKVKVLTNHNGGINGGITNGNPLIINSFVKATPSISKVQQSINAVEEKNIDLQIKGRHDPCIVHRVRIVQEALIAYALVDLIMENASRKPSVWNTD